ncbi:MAG: hypothetical protein PHI24_11000 [Desulfitobacteriaceae bacterium]|nr:hypothetical protein [Desulfitobacteriaceae bacterium]
MANKIIAVKNNRKGSISVATVNGLISMESGATRSNLEVTDAQVATLQTMADVAITEGLTPDVSTPFLGLVKESDLNVDIFDQTKLNSALDKIDSFAKMIASAAAGDLSLIVTPSVLSFPVTDKDFEHSVQVSLVDSKGKVHYWYDDVGLAVSLDKSSAAGSVSRVGDVPVISKGITTFTVKGTGTWLAGVKQIDKVSVVGTVITDGEASVTITPRTGESNIVVKVPVVKDDTAQVVAGEIRSALATDTAVTTVFTIGGDDVDVVFTAVQAAANDVAVSIVIDNDSCTGLTTSTSANVVPGVVQDSYTIKVAPLVIMGIPVAPGDTKIKVVDA